MTTKTKKTVSGGKGKKGTGPGKSERTPAAKSGSQAQLLASEDDDIYQEPITKVNRAVQFIICTSNVPILDYKKKKTCPDRDCVYIHTVIRKHLRRWHGYGVGARLVCGSNSVSLPCLLKSRDNVVIMFRKCKIKYAKTVWQVVRPANQLQLSDAEMKEERTRVLTANDPNGRWR